LGVSVAAKPKRRKRALELGAGVGYLSLCLAAWGYDMLATDVPPVLDSVLQSNVEEGVQLLRGLRARGRDVGEIQVAKLDWEEAARWDGLPWVNSDGESLQAGRTDLGPPFDMIVTTDTLYAPSLVKPFWSTILHLSRFQPSPPPVYIALENRDPGMIDSALDVGREMGFELKRIGAGRVGKAVENAGWRWEKRDWEGVEIWKAKLRLTVSC
jgi:hypothetical protein